jgi:hypothetical protein
VLGGAIRPAGESDIFDLPPEALPHSAANDAFGPGRND